MRDRTVAPTVIRLCCRVIYYYKQPYGVASPFHASFVTNIVSQCFPTCHQPNVAKGDDGSVKWRRFIVIYSELSQTGALLPLS